MKIRKFNHLSEEQRGIIRDMIYQNHSAREIGRELDVAASTIVREVKRNRMSDVPRIRKANRALYCQHFQTCGRKSDICQYCSSPYTFCKKCKDRKCYEVCKDFDILICEKLRKWPYICTSNCPKRNNCKYPKFHYAPIKAHEKYRNLLVNARDGICLTHDELIDLVNLIKPLIKQGHSPYAIWEIYKDKMPITERTFYNYMELGIMDIASIELPRKVRYKERDNKNKRKKTVVRIGREHCDYLNIPEEQRKNVFQIDTVHGFKYNKQRIFTMHNPLREFQFYNLIIDGRAERIIKIFDMYEEYLGSMELFKKIFGLILADRGDEFDMYNMLERSIYDPYKKRCHVYFCDPNRPDQKGSAENNHELLRRILEKGYSDFDKLSNADVALACSHVNSYPRKSLNGKAPIELIEKMVPKELLNKLGIEHLQPKEVVLKPSLLKHAISY